MTSRRQLVAAAVSAPLLTCALALTSCGSDAGQPQSGTTATRSASASIVAAAPAPATTRPATPSPARSTPAASADACAHNTAAQLVRVSVRQQHLWMCAGHTLVRDTPVTTGIPGEDTHTPTGTYTVQARTRHTTLTLLSGQTYDVQYWIPFDGPLFGFHDSSWQTVAYGSQQYRTDGSHGCVHLPLSAIAFLYRWVRVGATVRIRG